MIRSTLVSASTSRLADVDAEAGGAELGLAGGFFAGDVEDSGRGWRDGGLGRRGSGAAFVFRSLVCPVTPSCPVAASERLRDLQQQRGFPDARLAADQDRRAGDDAAAEDAVELADAAREARGVGFVDFVERQGFAGPGRGRRSAVPAAAASALRRPRQRGRRSRGFVFLERIPRAAVGALAHPLGMNAAALAAKKLDAGFGHVRTMFVSEQPIVGEQNFWGKHKRERSRGAGSFDRQRCRVRVGVTCYTLALITPQ